MRDVTRIFEQDFQNGGCDVDTGNTRQRLALEQIGGSSVTCGSAMTVTGFALFGEEHKDVFAIGARDRFARFVCGRRLTQGAFLECCQVELVECRLRPVVEAVRNRGKTASWSTSRSMVRELGDQPGFDVATKEIVSVFALRIENE